MPTITEIIRESSKLLVPENRNDSGVHLHLQFPLVSVYFGEESTKYMKDIQRWSENCWEGDSNSVVHITPRSESQFADDVKEGVQIAFTKGSRVFLAVYWDISSASIEVVDTILATLGEELGIPHGYSLSTIIYVFFQGVDLFTKKKIERIVEWNNGETTHKADRVYRTVLLGNTTNRGIISGDSIIENYRLASDMTTLADSQYGGRTASNFWFDMQQGFVFSAGYYKVGKPVDDITRISYIRVLDRYRALTSNESTYSSLSSLESRDACKRIIEDLISEVIIPLLPELHEAENSWFYLPFNSAYSSLANESGDKNSGLLSKLFSAKNRSNNTADRNNSTAVVKAQGSIWEGVVSKYYRGKVLKWLSDEGRAQIHSRLVRMADERIIQQMDGGEIRVQIELLRNSVDDLLISRMSNHQTTGSIEAQLHGYAIDDAVREIYPSLCEELADILENLASNASNFNSIVQECRGYLSIDEIDDGVNRAYSMLIDANSMLLDPIIRDGIHPAKSINELMTQISEVFKQMVEALPAYTQSYMEEAAWRARQLGQRDDAGEWIQMDYITELRNSYRIRSVESPRFEKVYTITGMTSGQVGAGEDAIVIPGNEYIEKISVFSIDDMDAIYWGTH